MSTVPRPAPRLRLQRYRESLPPDEYGALAAWCSSFYDFQLDWLLEDSLFGVSCKSRQIGISHVTGGIGVLWGAIHGEETTIISKGNLEAVEVLAKAKRHRDILVSLGSRMARNPRRTDNQNEMWFASGGKLTALPSTGGRGFSTNMMLDEFAYHEHAKEVWDSTAPATTLGRRIRVISTPNGVGNVFSNLWERAIQPRSKWATHLIPMSLAIAQGYPVDMDHCWELALGDTRNFDQFFNCSFLDAQMQYIPTAYIIACQNADLATTDGEYYAGLDIGREVDLTVLTVVRYVKGVRVLVWIEEMKRTDSDGLEAMVDRAFERFKLKRLCIDATGLGTFPAERIKKKHSERIDTAWRRPRVECINFEKKSKEALATGLYAAITGKTVKLPLTDAALRAIQPSEPLFPGGPEFPGCPHGSAENMKLDLASIKRVITGAGNVTYEAPHTARGHADRAWSLALALHACSSVNPMVAALAG